jgi:hypothetical protein
MGKGSLIAALAASFAGLASAQEVVSGGVKFKANYIGEPGTVYQHQTGSAADAAETGMRQAGGQGTHGPVGGAPKPETRERSRSVSLPTADKPDPEDDETPSGPDTPVGERPAPVPLARVQVAPHNTPPSDAKTEESTQGDGSPAESMQANLSKPLTMPSAKVADATEDEAAAASRADYESHILGSKPRPRADDAQIPQPNAVDLAQNLPPKPSEVFVTVDIDLKNNPDQYRDALADLAGRAMFRVDPRFAPAFSAAGPGRVSVAGWIPNDRVSAALQVPSVLKLETAARVPQHAAPTAVESPITISIRIPGGDPSSPIAREIVEGTLRELASSAEFRVEKRAGVVKIAGTEDASVQVIGRAPTKLLGRVMAHPSVLKTAPFIEPPAPQTVQQGETERFLRYAYDRNPFLFAVTAIMGFWSVAWALVRFADISIPYK